MHAAYPVDWSFHMHGGPHVAAFVRLAHNLIPLLRSALRVDEGLVHLCMDIDRA